MGVKLEMRHEALTADSSERERLSSCLRNVRRAAGTSVTLSPVIPSQSELTTTGY